LDGGVDPNTLEQLRVFHLVATAGSFSKAAGRLNRRVSAVSYSIANLERQFGFALFDRSSRNPTLTANGRSVLKEAEMLLRRVERLDAFARSLAGEAEQSLTVAVDAAFPEEALADGLVSLGRNFPAIAVRTTRRVTKAVHDDLLAGKADLGLIAIERGLRWDAVEAQEILEETISLVAASDHELTKAKAVTLRDLENHRQIYLADGWDTADTNDYRTHPTEVWTVDSVTSQIALVERGLGWAFIPESALQTSTERRTIARISCADILHPPKRRFAACRLVSRPPGPSLRHLVETLVRV
jgi:DNA-binding transcriptional LysR family regulator